MALPKKTVLAATLGMALMPSIALAAGKFTADDYKRALWMTTRFYGGQRSGVGPNWLIMDSQYPQSFTKDAYSGKDVSGGWFDCGDHVMYGQTHYWSAYALAKAYDEFPTGFDDLYDGATYSDYQKSGNFDIGGGKPNGIPDLVDELVYVTDFIAKAAISNSEFVAKKGVGAPDHALWVTPGYQSAKYSVAAGGESDGSRSITVNMGDGAMASNAAATLAIMSRILTRLGVYPEKASLYAAKAPVAYAYAAANKKTVAVSDGGAYPANARFEDDYASASLELYKLTNNDSYLKTANEVKSVVQWSNNGFCYNNNDHMTHYNYATIGGDAAQASKVTGLMTHYTSNVNPEKLTTVGDGWGALRYVAAGAMMGGLANKLQGGTTYDEFIFNQIDYILGANNAKQSFVTGFCSGCSKEPKYPHHRGVFLTDDVNWVKYNATKSNQSNGLAIPVRNRFHGSLLGGGSDRTSAFTENIEDHRTNEVCTDYNVGLVGALGYIVSKLAPVDTSKFGSGTGNVTRRTVQPLNVLRSGRSFEFRSPTGQALSEVKVLDASGREIWSDASGAVSVRWSADRSGLYVVQAAAGSQRYAASVAIP